MRNRKILGNLGESLAADYLQRRGHLIVEANYRTREGEIDLIALHNRSLVFVEVRTRTSSKFGYPIESIDGVKISKMRSVAWQYLKTCPYSYQDIRFDVIGVLMELGKEIQLDYRRDVLN